MNEWPSQHLCSSVWGSFCLGFIRRMVSPNTWYFHPADESSGALGGESSAQLGTGVQFCPGTAHFKPFLGIEFPFQKTPLVLPSRAATPPHAPSPDTAALSRTDSPKVCATPACLLYLPYRTCLHFTSLGIFCDMIRDERNFHQGILASEERSSLISLWSVYWREMLTLHKYLMVLRNSQKHLCKCFMV